MANQSKSALGFASASWHRAGREGLWIVAGQASSAVAGLVGVRILTELAPPNVLGEASLLLAIIALAIKVFLAPITNTQWRFFPEYQARSQANDFSRRMKHMIISAGVVMAVACLGAFVIWRLWTGGARLLLLPAFAIMLMVEPVKAYAATQLLCQRRQARSAAWAGTEAWMLIAASSLALLLSKTTEAYLLGQALGAAACAAVFGVMVRPPHDSQQDLPITESRHEFHQQMMGFVLPFIPLALVTWLQSVGERYVIGAQLGNADVGLYFAAYGLASRPFLMVGTMFSTLSRPIYLRAVAEKDNRRANRMMLIWGAGVVGSSGLIVGMFFLFGGLVAKLFLAKPYQESAPILFRWIAVGYAIFCVSQLLEFKLLALGRSGRLVWPAAVGAVFNVGAAMILVPKMGVIGGAVATVVSYIAWLIAGMAMVILAVKGRV